MAPFTRLSSLLVARLVELLRWMQDTLWSATRPFAPHRVPIQARSARVAVAHRRRRSP
jgi:hypothetical protein